MQLLPKRSSSPATNNDWIAVCLAVLIAIPLAILTMATIRADAAAGTSFDGMPQSSTLIMIIAGVALFLASRHRSLRR